MAGNKNTVQGLNVVLDGDNKGINQSLTSMNKEIKTSSKLAQDLNKNLTFDDDGIRNLNKQLSEVETQIELTKKKQEQLLQKLAQTEQGTQEYKKLETQIEKNKTSLTKLDKLQTDLNKDIKAMQTGNFDDLSKRSKEASLAMKDLNDETKKSNSGSEKFNELIATGTSLLNPYTLAIAGAGVALSVFTGDLKKTNESIRSYNKLTLDMNTNAQDFETTARKLSRTFGIEYEFALETVSQTQKIFNDYIDDSNDLMGLSIVTLDLLSTGYLSTEELQSSLSISTGVFNLSLEDSIDVMYREIKMMDKYGTRADDINDSYREFGDTMKMAGADEDDFFRIMEDGLKAGAKNTDEVVNSTNEYIIKLADATDATKQAYEDIGLSFDAVRTDMTNGDVEGAMLDTAVALEDAYVKVAEEQGTVMANAWVMAETGNIWGTPGEEFIAPWISKDAEDGVNNTELYAKNLEQLNLQNERLEPINLKVKTTFENNAGEAMGLSGQQVEIAERQIETLKTDYGELAPYVYALAQAYAGEPGSLEGSLKLATDAGIIQLSKIPAIQQAYEELRLNGLFTAKSQYILGLALKFAQDKLFLTTNQSDLLKDSYINLSGQSSAYKTIQDLTTFGTNENALALQAVNKQTTDLLTNQTNLLTSHNILVGKNGEVTKSWESYNAMTGQTDVITKTIDTDTASLKEKLDFLGSGLISTQANLDIYNASLRTLRDDTSTTEEKTQALSDIMSVLNSEGLAVNTELYAKLNPLLEKSGKFSENKAKADEKSADILKGKDGLNAQVEEESRLAGDATGTTNDLATAVDDLGESAGYRGSAGDISNLNKEIDEYNGKQISQKEFDTGKSKKTTVSANQQASTSSFQTPQMASTQTYATPTFTPQSYATPNSLSTINVNLAITANTTSPAELAEYVAEPLTQIINEQLGRLY